ncbi:zinc finger protein Ci-ZF(C2H2)-56 [Ciona intestinalis]
MHGTKRLVCATILDVIGTKYVINDLLCFLSNYSHLMFSELFSLCLETYTFEEVKNSFGILNTACEIQSKSKQMTKQQTLTELVKLFQTTVPNACFLSQGLHVPNMSTTSAKNKVQKFTEKLDAICKKLNEEYYQHLGSLKQLSDTIEHFEESTQFSKQNSNIEYAQNLLAIEETTSSLKQNLNIDNAQKCQNLPPIPPLPQIQAVEKTPVYQEDNINTQDFTILKVTSMPQVTLTDLNTAPITRKKTRENTKTVSAIQDEPLQDFSLPPPYCLEIKEELSRSTDFPVQQIVAEEQAVTNLPIVRSEDVKKEMVANSTMEFEFNLNASKENSTATISDQQEFQGPNTSNNNVEPDVLNVSTIAENQKQSSKKKKKKKKKKQYVCKICKSLFEQRAQFRQHVKVHSKIKPYKCEVCQKGFGKLKSLNQHKINHNIFSCQYCNSVFTQKSDLDQHHTPGHCPHFQKQVTPCFICGQQYKRKTSFSKHMREKHNIYIATAGLTDTASGLSFNIAVPRPTKKLCYILPKEPQK